MDYEEMIFNRQESMEDDCKNCSYKTECENQCEKVTVIYNPNLIF
jgi:radical SAM protein with 4Fe4S-binding SPASM domain